ncbi:MAG: acetoacetate--CoA ligase [Deltaproteobacteria bacterium]|nr:acetoacetate--CoA ligase [Deltaproteobacteria bacterium]
MSSAPLWTPSPERVERSAMRAFQRGIEARTGRRFASYTELWRWSVDERAEFWRAAWDFCELIGDPGPAPFLVDDRMPGARFFPGARLSYAENLLRRTDPATALIFRGEDGSRRELSFAELRAQVGSLAAELRRLGISAGDRVAAILPNGPEAIVAMLAATSLGAIWSSCSPDFGVRGVLDRFGQIEPKLLFACDGYRYAGKTFDLSERVAEIRAALPSLSRLVTVDFVGARALPGALDFGELARSRPGEPEFARLPFDHPLFILYSSGTTGAPKCIVHGAGAVLAKIAVEQRLHTDLRRGDRLFYFTTCGWMMWNWLATGLAAGATLVLYDGSPFHPDERVLFDLVDAERVTVFGTSAKYLDAVRKSGLEPRATHDLSSVETILSTGSVLAPESFDFVYRGIKPDVLLSSISGGTDIAGCFVAGSPTLPVRRGEAQCLALGMAVDVFDDAGRALAPGEKGELVCTRAFPSMPVGFWNDPDGARYRASYFERFPGVWHHGDWVELTPNGGMTLYGRSDAVLNPGGVRIGTAEIYRPVEQLDEIAEALAIGQDWAGDVRVVLFVRPRDGVALDAPLEAKIRAAIRAHATPRHVPARIVAVSDIPRTKSGKIVELAVRDVVHGRAPKNLETLANPEALAQFTNRPELAS